MIPLDGSGPKTSDHLTHVAGCLERVSQTHVCPRSITAILLRSGAVHYAIDWEVVALPCWHRWYVLLRSCSLLHIDDHTVVPTCQSPVNADPTIPTYRLRSAFMHRQIYPDHSLLA